MARNFTLDRRTMLRGVGAALSLPLLEAMLPRNWARAQGLISPPRYVFMVGAVSMGPDVNPPAGYPDAPRGVTIPLTDGTDYVMPRGLASLTPIRNDVAIVSGLTVPTTGPASLNPAQGFIVHDTFTFAMSCGKTYVPVGGGPYYTSSKGPTSDQLLIPDLAGTTTYPSLALRIDSTKVPNGREEVSHKLSGGSLVPNVANGSPQSVFQTLFGMLQPGLTPTEQERRLLAQSIHVNVVDAVLERANALKAKLGKADQQRLEQHLAEVHDLQTRVGAAPPSLTGVCAIPTDPGADPTGDASYKGEVERAQAMVRLAHMALACDLTRIVTIGITVPANTNLNVKVPLGLGASRALHFDVHHLSSNPGTAEQRWELQADALNWHVGVFSDLCQKLKATPDANGTLLDRAAVIFMPDNGWMTVTSVGADFSGSHSTHDVQMLVGGRVGGLQAGRHLASGGGHPSAVIFTAMKAVGYTGSALGEWTTELPGLRVA